jgi:hypothetical protein
MAGFDRPANLTSRADAVPRPIPWSRPWRQEDPAFALQIVAPVTATQWQTRMTAASIGAFRDALISDCEAH